MQRFHLRLRSCLRTLVNMGPVYKARITCDVVKGRFGRLDLMLNILFIYALPVHSDGSKISGKRGEVDVPVHVCHILLVPFLEFF
jgi:hypothetical protein